MPTSKDKKLNYDPAKQLDLLNVQCKSITPTLYKTNSLYLKIIRDSLPKVIRQAIIQLIINNNNNLESISQIETRVKLKLCIEVIVAKCIKQITIKDLIDLSLSTDKELEEDLVDLKKIELKDLSIVNQEDQEKIDKKSTKSIELSMSMPTDENIKTNKWNLDDETLLNTEMIYKSNISSDNTSNSGQQCLIDKNNLEESDITNKDPNLLKSIFSIARQVAPFKRINSEDTNKSSLNKIDIQEKKDSTDFNSVPTNPLELYKWNLSLDLALNRRLRNLSHAINMELLRIGLINSFVPVNLLDAVITGQIGSLNSPSNLLKMQFPLEQSEVNDQVHITCLLIQPSDLEFDDLRLRKCRYQMIQHRNRLSKMVKQERYWKSRSLANEVREQWLQNTPTVPIKKKISSQ